jgi:NTE family protein
MAYPFMFKPISIDNKLLFDGGIFNNFPVNVMRSDFRPDYIIGSVVAYNPPKAEEDDIVMQLQNMIITRTDYSLPSSEGLLLHFNLEKINVFDFSKVDELVKMGYDSTLKHIDEIKARIPRRVTLEVMDKRRSDFRNKFPELKFQHIEVTGIDSLQKQYVQRSFHHKENVFSLSAFKQSYFKLISDDKISEVIPHAVFNPANGLFDLNLNVKTEDQLKAMLGGNISSSTFNQAYVGFTYQNLSDYAQSAFIDAQFGKFYNGLALGTRIELPAQKSWYVKVGFVMHSFDYFDGNRQFYEDTRSSSMNVHEAYGRLSIGFPLTMKDKIEFGIGYGALADNYNQNGSVLNSTTGNDRSTFSIGKLSGRVESNTLNNIMYPTKGFNYLSSIQFFYADESFKPALLSDKNLSLQPDTWFQYHAKFDRYFPVSTRLTLGTYGELVYSTRRLLQNYTVTLIQSPAFQPTPSSRTVFNDAFRASQFVAIGLKPVYNLTDQIHVRGEAYLFMPYKSFLRANDNTAYYSAPFHSMQFMAETSLVYNFKLASAGLFMSNSAGHWSVGMNIGILLFNPKFME